ncbi:hypothetical protein ENUP19_0058G0033 [Entamoeba nuttalli]|uniref:EF-hand domain-containing protein n=1 Tax=Entamoeba nuttalli TaxID=412467 RepID=A0ABQ0DD65_9EUKA
MSKSIDDTEIFIEEENKRKTEIDFVMITMKNQQNEYIKYILIRWFGEIEGNVYKTIDEIAEHFKEFDKNK